MNTLCQHANTYRLGLYAVIVSFLLLHCIHLSDSALAAVEESQQSLESSIRAAQTALEKNAETDKQVALEAAHRLITLKLTYLEKLAKNEDRDSSGIRKQIRSLARTVAWQASVFEKRGEFALARKAWADLTKACDRFLGRECSEYWDANQEAIACKRLSSLDDTKPQYASFLKNRDNLRKATKNLKLNDALDLAMNDYSACASLFGSTHPRTLTSLEYAAKIAFSKKDFDRAFSLFEKALDERRESYPSWHSAVSKATLNIGSRYELVGDFEKAENKFRLAPDDLSKWSCLARVATKYQSKGNRNRALSLYREITETNSPALDPLNPLRGLAGNKCGDIYLQQGRYDDAERILQQSVVVWKQSGNSLQLANCLYTLALVAQRTGTYESAETRYHEAMELVKGSQGGSARNLQIAIHSNFASLLEELGRYPDARKIYERIRDESSQSSLLPVELTAMENLARLYQTIGELSASEVLLDNLLTIPGRQPAELFRLHSLRGRLFLQMDAYEKARLEFDSAEELIGDSASPHDRANLDSLQALLKLETGELRSSRDRYKSALKTLQTLLGPSHVNCGEIHDQLAKVYRSLHEYDLACEHHEKAIKIYQSAYSDGHETVAWAFHRIGTTHFVNGKTDLAREAWRNAFSIKRRICREILPWLPEAQATAFLTALTTDDSSCGRDAILTILRDDLVANAATAFSYTWQSTGLVLDALAVRQRLSSTSISNQAQREQLTAIRRRLAQLSITSGTESAQQKASRFDLLRQLSTEKEMLERTIAESAMVKGEANADDYSASDLIQQLPSELALVQFVRTLRWEKDADHPTKIRKMARYDAFVVKRDHSSSRASVHWIELGDAPEIEKHLQNWREQILRRSNSSRGRRMANKKKVNDANLIESRKFLHETVWQPVSRLVGNRQQVVVVPDGQLHRMPWPALPGESTQYLAEEIQVTTTTDGRQLNGLLSRTIARKSDQPVLLVGGIEYDLTLPAPPAAQSSRDRNTLWPFLPGTQDEIQTISKTIAGPPVRTLVGEEATESRVKAELMDARYVHFATHGFFADQTGENDAAGNHSIAGNAADRMTSETLTTRNPLLLCGLTLAGCNDKIWLDDAGIPLEVQDDGYLTAEELMGMDLSDTELVVMSACETGLGTIANGEGVFGLQRALHLSGVVSTIASQWKVDDNATKHLMVEFYSALHNEKMPAAAALRAAQLKMLRYFDPETGSMAKEPVRKAAPYYWAAFSLCGAPN